MKNLKWIQESELPLGMLSCVALPPTSSVALPITNAFACVLAGGCTEEESYSSTMDGLSRLLNKWNLLKTLEKDEKSPTLLFS